MIRPSQDSPALLEQMMHAHWVGRVHEMAEASALWQRVVQGEGQVLLVSGEPGIGKTRIVNELASTVRLDGAIVLVGACYAEGSVPYSPIVQIIEDIFEKSLQPGLIIPDEIRRYLFPIVPSVNSHFPEKISDQNTDPQTERRQVIEAFFSLCSILSSQSPLLLFIDDIHWADTDTLFLVKQLARRGRKLPVLIVLTYREAELESTPVLQELLVDLNRERLSLHLHLGRLNRSETYDLLASIFDKEIAPSFLEGIYQQTEGNPFFIEEVCKTLIEAGQIFFREGQWHYLANKEIKIPQTVRSALQLRLMKLPKEAQDMLRMAALLGREFDFETLKQACFLKEDALIDALESAIHAQLISEAQPVQTAGARFTFVHTLIPTTLRESITQVRRQRLHLHAAQAIETVHPGDFEALAYQYSESGNLERARQFYLRAGDRAQGAAPQEAARFYQTALDHWPIDADQAGRAETLSRLGYCLWILDDIPGAHNCYEMAFTIFAQLGNRTQSGEMQRMIGRMYWEQANRAMALDYYYRALTILEQEPESIELARAIDSIGQAMMLTHDNEQGIIWGERALKMAEALHAESVIVSALYNIGCSYAQNGQYEKGNSLLVESIRQANILGLSQTASRAYFGLGVMYQRQCQYHKAEDVLKELHSYSIKYYTKTFTHLALWRLVWVYWSVGQWKTALDIRTQLFESSGTLYAVWAKRVFGMIDLDLGRTTEALKELEDSLPGAVRADDFQTTISHWGQIARAYAATEQMDKMMDAIHQILEFVKSRSYQSHEAIMPLLIACQLAIEQNTSLSDEIARSCLACLKQHAQQFQTEEANAALAESQGLLMLREEHIQEAMENFRLAAALWERIERRFDQARVLGKLGHASKALLDPTNARAAYHQALEIIDSLASQLDSGNRASFLSSIIVKEIQDGLASLERVILPKSPKREANPLTDREIEVLLLVSQGLTNPQIAEQLVLSPLTVNAHLRSIFNKLDVTTRTAAVHQAMELDLL